MSAHREEHLALCAGFVLGALTDADRVELERHLAEGCPACDAEIARLSSGAALLAASAPPVAPPAGMKTRVFDRIRAEGERRPIAAPAPAPAATPPTRAPGRAVLDLPTRRRAPIPAWGFAAAAVLMAVTSLALWRTAADLRTELAATRQQLAEQSRQLADAKQWAELLEGSNTRFVDLQITPQGAALLKARAVYDPNRRRALLLFSHFTPPPGSDYQLWALRDGKPASLGVIHADADGRAIVRLPDTGDPASLGAFAVSLEKAGGTTMPAPEGPVVMVGALSGP